MADFFVDDPGREIRAKGCFVCGRENPRGLGIPFFYTGDKITAAFIPDDTLCGFDGIVHGGIISALADEAMMHLLWASGMRAVTAEIAVRFHDYCAIGTEIQMEAHLVERSPRLITAICRLHDPAGKKIATARGKFLPLSGSRSGLFAKAF